MNEIEGIACPDCNWRPDHLDRWECDPECGALWNTFWTHGICPGCAKHWQETQCLHCGKISPHPKWYKYRSINSADSKAENSRESN
ncbi:hypothetical protein ASD35_15540 [Pelomonas sp. Root1444]|nr:hypothetical protein ASD35_15540 [Pelomonas sp. Root1444]